MGELDENIASVWQTILAEGPWLARRIIDFHISLELVRSTLEKTPSLRREKAFQTLLRNRVQRGGIMAPGASLMKSGENGKGVASRWYPQTLAKRIMVIYGLREKITFVHGDGFSLISKFAQCPQAAFFIDPPYTAGGKRAGKRLYLHNEVDHRALFALMAEASGDFLMTYDEAPEVEGLALEFGFSTRKVPMKNTHHAKLVEMLITRT
jgi:DNA adenine methylase